MSAPMNLLLRVLLSLLLARSTCAFLPPPSRCVRTQDQLFMGKNMGALRELVTEQQAEKVGTNVTADSDDDFCLVDFGNFWRKTQANFTSCDDGVPDRSPDFKSKGSKGSKYWDMGDHVIRYSNHWSGQHGIGRIVDCEWTIDSTHIKKAYSTGMCKYIDFRKGKVTANEKRKLRQKKKR
mmetsp:Transcript_13824/g.22903  ORF Transcript_13824/g.22903 Transcript_13824/m.22903 type:complete len:180 (+) Transcript_13824:102-641(+)|eukprot:CAMPEP_0119014430 /NCGR_PEP_ID=MMETSP1176-20130426/9735_1 /TAXON_ID=265551 /ORGANISM="Synedropsis recta cf, Strain CCMP1620" /LENGTH=179 /DNA_ID=CAMNT_0006967609 /DNA_START=89 /DNA_END=628 /DNA_ORIENTATION=-